MESPEKVRELPLSCLMPRSRRQSWRGSDSGLETPAPGAGFGPQRYILSLTRA